MPEDAIPRATLMFQGRSKGSQGVSGYSGVSEGFREFQGNFRRSQEDSWRFKGNIGVLRAFQGFSGGFREYAGDLKETQRVSAFQGCFSDIRGV